jgi:hypothetical protein
VRPFVVTMRLAMPSLLHGVAEPAPDVGTEGDPHAGSAATRVRELGARPHPPRELYRAYLEQSHVFVGVFWQRYGWIAPGEELSGLEDEYRLGRELPGLFYLKEPAPDREPRLQALLTALQEDDRASYRRFTTTAELAERVQEDLALLLTERFEATAGAPAAAVPEVDVDAAELRPLPVRGSAPRGAAATAPLGRSSRRRWRPSPTNSSPSSPQSSR